MERVIAFRLSRYCHAKCTVLCTTTPLSQSKSWKSTNNNNNDGQSNEHIGKADCINKNVSECASTDWPTVAKPQKSKLQNFKQFFSLLTRTKECTSLPPTALGYAGSERILNNIEWHTRKWQASCIELRECDENSCGVGKGFESNANYCYDEIDFAALRAKAMQTRSRQVRANEQVNSNCIDAMCNKCSDEYIHKNTTKNHKLEDRKADESDWNDYYDIKSLQGSTSKNNVDDFASNSGNKTNEYSTEKNKRLEVVHYFETSCSEGLRGYQQVATRVYLGELPGWCRNYAAEGGFAVWVVPHDEYITYCNQQLKLTSGKEQPSSRHLIKIKQPIQGIV